MKPRTYEQDVAHARATAPIDEDVAVEAVRDEWNENPPSEDIDEPELLACPSCGGAAQYMGNLGARRHYRCQGCGIDSSRGPS